MTRFTLQPRRWYACMLLGDEFDASAMCSLSPTPIHVGHVKPLATGERTFELAFFHANYPEGVQDKVYLLQTIHRGEAGLLAKSIEHDPPRFLYITDITTEWLHHHFPKLELGNGSVQDGLNRIYGGQVG